MKKTQNGATLLEVLVALLLFAFGILGLLGMQAVASQMTGEAKYRAEAAMYADQLISQMWTDDTAALAAQYDSTMGGAKFVAWRNQIQAAGTGLPGATGTNEPVVSIDANNVVTVTISWQAPTDVAPHHHVVVAQIRK
ncbi:type IV pilus modification protein PilV [Sulfuricystis multivorans]|uniref:type IV pilus modification protein PilV n=1 Tax=Sulfuricystis multivorans TaxID=2211108 RepID=UPI000F839114|nr:type IV pilus modification protein PilV [Sulfuricystis multivorans]